MPAIYTNEFKKQVAHRVVRDRVGMSDVAREFGVSYSNVYRWANDARYNEVDVAPNAVAPQDYAGNTNNNNNIRVIKGLKLLGDFRSRGSCSIGDMNVICPFCLARRYAKEREGLCCLKSKIQLPPQNSIPENYRLLLQGFFYLTNLTLYFVYLDISFRKDIRKYNASMAWTSMGANVDERLANQRDGVYTFKISGQLSHKIGSLLPQRHESHKFAQIYFLDGDEQVTRRNEVFGNRLDNNILAALQQMLTDLRNPYVELFIQAREFPNTEEMALRIFRDSAFDPRRYNLPTVSEVAAVIVDRDIEHGRDIVIKSRTGFLQQIQSSHPSYSALSYPLLFPRGENGWRVGIPYNSATARTKLSMRDWACYYLQQRIEDNMLHLSGRLFQQFVVDIYAQIEQDRLLYLRYNQDKIRADVYQGLIDATVSGEFNRIGRRVVLPSSFTGGDRYMIQVYADSMCLVRTYGKPDIFVTMTCNPNWAEIQAQLPVGYKAEDRPDIVARVFHLKLKEFIEDVKKGLLDKSNIYVFFNFFFFEF